MLTQARIGFSSNAAGIVERIGGSAVRQTELSSRLNRRGIS